MHPSQGDKALVGFCFLFSERNKMAGHLCGMAMKLAGIELGSDEAYRQAAKIVIEQIEFELETCQRLLGTDPGRVITLLANTPNWGVFFEESE